MDASFVELQAAVIAAVQALPESERATNFLLDIGSQLVRHKKSTEARDATVALGALGISKPVRLYIHAYASV